MKVLIPADVPGDMHNEYESNYRLATQNSGKLMLFAGDQKIEHLNADFLGKGIHKDDSNPSHLFDIASKGNIGVFASQLGLIARYGNDYRNVNYLVKLNSKTNLVSLKQKDPYSQMLLDVDQVAEFKNQSGLRVVGVGYTLYLGSEFEAEMLTQASQIAYEAHRHGMLAVFWIYPRGKSLKDETAPQIIAGAAGVAACLGADFVKLNPPKVKGKKSMKSIKDVVNAAGRTKVIFSGGGSTKPEVFLKELSEELKEGAMGNATGRNIHQKSLPDAMKFTSAIYAMVVENATLQTALKIFRGK